MKSIAKLIVPAFILTACFTERIDLDLNEDNTRLVVSAWITNLDEPQFVKVSRTVNYLDDQSEDLVADAIVTLSDESETYLLNEIHQGYYYLPHDWTSVVGDLYTLTIQFEGQEYIATHRMNRCPEIDSLSFRDYMPEDPFEEEEYDEPVYETIFAFQETPGSGDAYYFIDYLKGSLAGDSVQNGGFVDDQYFDGAYLKNVVVTESDRLYFEGDTVVVEMHSIGVSSYFFLEEMSNVIYGNGPFDPPPANVKTNISNGAVGYFIISDARRDEIVIQSGTDE